ncbi:unnamed protein product [Closterium sp. NIES-54]
MTTLWVLLHVAAQRDYELHSLDFRSAFLQGSLHEEIWLCRPPGFTGSFPAGTQWSLRRQVYGLRQAPREWHDTLRMTLAALGFAPSTSDPSLFLRTDTTLPPFYILVYVDDLVFATSDTEALAHVKSELQKRHTCTDLGERTSYLGLRITRERAQRTITLTHSHMVQEVLQRFGFTYFSPQSTPLPTSHSLSTPPSDESVEPSGPYPELVGCLMYMITCTRPDLAYPLRHLARYVAPGRHRKVHWDAAKRVLRYLCSTSGMGLVLGGWARVVLGVVLAARTSFAQGDCYRGVPPDPGIAAAAVGASKSGTLPGTAPAEALHTFTLDSGTSRCFFRDTTTLTPLPAPVPVSASGQVAASCSCHLLSHQTLLWHHRLGHHSLPRLRGMHSRLLVSGLPRSLPPLPPSPAPPCLPCVKGRQRAAPHSSSFPPTIAPLQNLHMDVWGPARVSGQSRERYFLLVVDDYTRYTKGQVVDVLIPWIRTVRLQLRERFRQEIPVLRQHSDRGGEFSSSVLRDFCRGEGILQSFTLPDSPEQNGIVEVARTSMIHAAAPHFLWPFAVRYAAHQLNLSPHVSLPETSSTLRWTGEVGDASVFQVWGFCAFVHDTSADKLSPCAIPCVFLGFGPDAPGWHFYHPTSRRVFPSLPFPSQCARLFDESVLFYRLFPYRSAPPPPPPLFLAPGPPPVAVDSGAARGIASGGAEPEGDEIGGAEPEGVATRGAALEGVESGGAEPRGATSSGGFAGASPRVSPQQLREWFVQRTHLWSGASGGGGAGAAGARGSGVAAGAGVTGGPATTGHGGARTRAGGAGVSGPGAGRAGAVDPCGTVRPRPYFVPLLQQVLGTPPSAALTPPLLCPSPDLSQPPLQPASPLPAPSPYTEQTRCLREHRKPASRPVSPVCTTLCVPRSRPPHVPGKHAMALRPSSVPLCVPLPALPASSLPEVPDPESDRARAASPTVSRLLATAVTDPSFESAAASALVAELLDFAAACRLDYASALVAESASTSLSSVGGECALGTDVLEDRQEEFECLAAAVTRFASMLLAPEGDPDAPDIPTSRSYAEAIAGAYVDEVPPPGANIVNGMWIFRVKRPPGSPPAFKERYIARGFSQRQGVDYFQTFSPTLKMTTLRVLLHVAAQRDYELHSLDFSTAFLQGSLHEEIWLCHLLVSLSLFLQWHDTLRTTIAALGFAPATVDPSLFLRTDTLLPPFYVLVYVNDRDFATAYTEALTLVKSELQKRHTYTDLDSTTQEFKLYHGKGGLYIGKAVLKNNVFVLDFVPDQGIADSDAIVNFAS